MQKSTPRVRTHDGRELSGAAKIGLDAFLPHRDCGTHAVGRSPLGRRPAFVLRRNSTAARQETRFARGKRNAFRAERGAQREGSLRGPRQDGG